MLNGVKAALSTATTLTHLQASLQNKLGENVQTINYSGYPVKVQNGFPIADWSDAIYPIMDMNASVKNSDTKEVCKGFDFCASDQFDIHGSNLSALPLAPGKLVVIWMQDGQLSDDCFAYFHQPNNGRMPTSATITTGC